MIVHRDHQALTSVYDPCLDQICAVRIDFDHHIRRLNIEFLRLCDI